MGTHQKYLQCSQSQLRKIEPAPVRQEMFGNPFRTDKVGLNEKAVFNFNLS